MVLGHVSQLTWEVLKDFWQINVTALTPLSSLSATEAQKEWEKAIHDLRKDGARPREVLSPYLPPYALETEYLPLKTDKGVIMVTSLANFRSDYTVVCIPDGDFLAYQELSKCKLACTQVFWAHQIQELVTVLGSLKELLCKQGSH